MASDFAKRTTADLHKLQELLREASDGQVASLQRSLAEKDEARILNLACGASHETETLIDFVSKLGEDPLTDDLRKVRFRGIDIRAREIADAQLRFAGKGKSSDTLETDIGFLHDDATKLDQLSELEGEADLIFLRHQNYWHGDRIWDEIFEQAAAKLDEDGRLMITSYFDREHAQAIEALEKAGLKLRKSITNDDSRVVNARIQKTIDRHVAIFEKVKG